MRYTFIILAVLATGSLRAQIPSDTTYAVEVSATASPMVSLFSFSRVPETENTPAFGYGVFLRCMWHPARLLSVGILTGYALISQDEIASPSGPGSCPSAYHARLTAVPLQIALTMRTGGFEGGVGLGPYLVMSSIEGGSCSPAFGKRLEIAMTYFGSYYFDLGDAFMIGPELRIMNLSLRRITTIMPSFTVRYTPLRY